MSRAGRQGIGRAICEVFAEEGARLTIADIDVEGGEQTLANVRAAGGEAQFVETDVSKEADVEAMVRAAVDAHGAVNILVNDAAAFVFGEVQDVSDADWMRVFGVNVIGQAYCVKHVLPHMQAAGGGAIVNLASVSGFIAQPAFIPYNASKGAVMQLTRCLAMDLAPYNITSELRVPGICADARDRAAPAVRGRGSGRSFWRRQEASNFMKRVADPREIAYGALFLASDEASFVTGTPLVMDGGLTAQ